MCDEGEQETLLKKIKVLSGFAFPATGFDQHVGLPLIRIRDLARAQTEVRFKGQYDPAYLIMRGDVLVGMDGDFEVHRWRGGNALLNQRVCKVESGTDQLDQGFLYWFLKPQVADIHRRTPQTTVRHLSASDLYRIPAPKISLREQFLVAKILDTLDTVIHETEAIIAKLKAVKQGLLHDLLTRGIDANGELRPPQAEAPHLYKESHLGWIPKEWNVKNLGACAEIASGVTLGRTLTGHGFLQLPYLRVANVQDGYVDLTDVKTVPILRNELERFALADGDVLMNEGGDYDKLGRGTVWRAQIQPCLHQNHVFRVRCNRDVLMPDYLAAYSASQRGKAFFILSSKQSTNLASINSTQLKSFPIACPSLLEQHHMTERLASVDERVSSENTELKKLLALKSALMTDLLTGRVRVTPLLEPAP